MSLFREASLYAADYVLTFVWLKGSLLVLALLLLRAPLRRYSASTHAAVWTFGATALLALPFLPALVPPASLAVIAFPMFLFNAETRELASWIGVAPVASAREGVAGWAGDLPAAVWLGTVWMAGAALLLGRFGRQWLAVRRIAREAEPAGNPLLERAGRVCKALAPRRPIRLACSAAVSGPMTFGWRRPVILLPIEARTWTPEWTEAVLSHEIAHVVRRDYLVLMLGELVRALYWPNPLVWMIPCEARAELERACDDAVLRSGVRPDEYARQLVMLAARQRLSAADGALPIVRRAFLRARVRAILDDGADRAAASRHVLFASAALLAVLVSVLGSAVLWSCSAAGGVSNGPAAVTSVDPPPSAN